MMYYISAVLFSFLIVGSCSEYQLPSSLKLGAGSSAMQIEGGWNASDRGESTWDYYLRLYPDRFDGNTEVACDSYRLWRRDIEMAEELGLQMYRFSVSWSRLLPTGLPDRISEDGKNYYSNLIDGLLERGIEPVVTIHHFDLPQRLQNLGGWTNPLIADWFADYARVVYSLYADRVKTWLTINEPLVMCDAGYRNQTVPFLEDGELGQYLCNKHALLAHAKAYRIYDNEYKPLYNGKVSIVNLFMWYEPVTTEDVALTELTVQYGEGRYAHAIYSEEGGWPKELEAYLLEQSDEEGRPTARLPPFTPEEVELVRGTYDFYAFNHYTTRFVRKARPCEVIGAWPFSGSEELGVVFETSTGPSDSWFSVYPKGLRKLLNYLKNTYSVSEFFIAENGYVSKDASLNDTNTIDYIRRYLEQVALAIQDGVNVTGYTHWSLMDSFELGYTSKFGLYAVDFSDGNRTRTARESARYYSSVIETRVL